MIKVKCKNVDSNLIEQINTSANLTLSNYIIIDIFANPITNYQVYFSISNLMLITSTNLVIFIKLIHQV